MPPCLCNTEAYVILGFQGEKNHIFKGLCHQSRSLKEWWGEEVGSGKCGEEGGLREGMWARIQSRQPGVLLCLCCSLFFLHVCCNNNAAITVIDSLFLILLRVTKATSSPRQQQISFFTIKLPTFSNARTITKTTTPIKLSMLIVFAHHWGTYTPKAPTKVTRMLKDVRSSDIKCLIKQHSKTTTKKLNRNQCFSCSLYSQNQWKYVHKVACAKQSCLWHLIVS